MQLKKSWIIGLFIGIVLSIVIVSALTSSDYTEAGNSIIDTIKSIFTPFFAALLGGSVEEYFFEKILMLALLYIVILTVLKKVEVFSKVKIVPPLISLIVSVIAIRYITEIQFVQGILVPYGVLGTAILVFLPFLIWFFFVHNSIESASGRKLAWIVFLAVFIGIWLKVREKIGSMNWVYYIGFGLVVLAFIFDRQIRKYLNLIRQSKHQNRVDQAEIANLQTQLERYSGGIETDEKKKTRDLIKKKIKDLGGNVPEF